MYEITEDTEIYTDQFGHEVIVTDNLDFYIKNLHYDSIKLSENIKPSIIRSLYSQLKNINKK